MTSIFHMPRLFDRSFILLLSIFVLSFLLRFIQLDTFPPSPNWDEVSLGYNAWSILHTAKDEWSQTLPLIFQAFGDYKLPLYIYASLPFVWLFGLNSISIKLISVLAGSLLSLVVFFILKHLFPKSHLLPYAGSLMIAFSPWSITLSRIALEANLFVLLYCLAFYGLISRRLNLSLIAFSLSLFTYNSARVLFPVYLILLVLVAVNNKIKLRLIWPGLIVLFAAVSIFIFQTINVSGSARYQWVTLLDDGAINRINEARGLTPGITGRIIHNKLTYFIGYSSLNYLKHFHPSYLFYRGGSHYQFNVPDTGLISPLYLPLLLLGLLTVTKSVYSRFRHPPRRYLTSGLIILVWFFTSPLPSAITRDAPHTLRSITFFPVVIILMVFGLKVITDLISTPKLLPFLCLLFVTSLVLTYSDYWIKYQRYTISYSQSWQYGYRQVVDYVKSNYSTYDRIIVTKKYGEPHEFFLFYWPWDPSRYQTDPRKIWDYHAQWYWVDAFDKFEFVNDWDIKDRLSQLDGQVLLVTSPGNYQTNGVKLLKTINFLDNTTAFQILTYEP